MLWGEEGEGLTGSIFLTLWPLPGGLALHPQRWTQLIHGNATITTGLFLMR